MITAQNKNTGACPQYFYLGTGLEEVVDTFELAKKVSYNLNRFCKNRVLSWTQKEKPAHSRLLCFTSYKSTKA